MFFIIGTIVVLGCVMTGYGAHGGNMKILWQPFEVLIIAGAAIGAFIISNPPTVVKDVLHSLKKLMKGIPYKQDDYVELLSFLFAVFKLMKTKGLLEIESHIENPEESELFGKYPSVQANHHAIEFFCDIVRMMTMGMDDHFQMEEVMGQEIEAHHHDAEAASGAVSNMADGLPALGIVAAVLGVINTMGSITEPPEVLGALIGAALVGTFLGVLLAYGFVGPVGTSLGKIAAAESHYFEVMKVALLAHMQGNAPAISVEFARKAVPGHFRPSFKELEDAIAARSAAPAA